MLAEVKSRGLVAGITNEERLAVLLREPENTIYIGFDPTADSLHVGHLLPLVTLTRLQRAGHRTIALVGGATAMIGDPSGKDAERELQNDVVVRNNALALQEQIERIGGVPVLNNLDWFSQINIIHWLTEIGKCFSVNTMIARESVKRRLNEREQGISFTEFSYSILQAQDFLHLCQEHGCMIQAGGSDQWGNITAGIDLIHRKTGKHAVGFTMPLITTKSGEKFGKTAGNAVWLDPNKTSPFEFFQFWINVADEDVERFLKFFTFLTIDEIDDIVFEHQNAPHLKIAQKRLAEEVTRFVHGVEGLQEANRATEVLFGGSLEGLSNEDLKRIFKDVPSTRVADFERLTLVDLLLCGGICESKSKARKLLSGGGVNLNNQRVCEDRVLTKDDLATESFLVVRVGKKKFHLFEVKI